MEMHRRASPWRWLPVYWYNLYKFLSGYGELPLWAFTVLLAFLFGLAGLAWAFGLGFKHGLASLHGQVSYWDALVFILEKVTLQRPDWLVPQNLISRVLAGLSVLIIPGQAALFILSLRNRLGRRR
jgi:hypothetical protein